MLSTQALITEDILQDTVNYALMFAEANIIELLMSHEMTQPFITNGMIQTALTKAKKEKRLEVVKVLSQKLPKTETGKSNTHCIIS